jgi:hypothetical protein
VSILKQLLEEEIRFINLLNGYGYDYEECPYPFLPREQGRHCQRFIDSRRKIRRRIRRQYRKSVVLLSIAEDMPLPPVYNGFYGDRIRSDGSRSMVA